MARFSLTLADGRQLEVERLSLRDRMRVIRAMGTAADIDRYAAPVMVATCVRSIDGVPVIPPVTVDQCDSLMERLGEAALGEVAQGLTSAPPDAVNVERAKN